MQKKKLVNVFLQVKNRSKEFFLQKHIKHKKKNSFYICTRNQKKRLFWSVRLGVRTPGFHPGNTGSIPVRTTSLIDVYREFNCFYKLRIKKNKIIANIKKYCIFAPAIKAIVLVRSSRG